MYLACIRTYTQLLYIIRILSTSSEILLQVANRYLLNWGSGDLTFPENRIFSKIFHYPRNLTTLILKSVKFCITYLFFRIFFVWAKGFPDTMKVASQSDTLRRSPRFVSFDSSRCQFVLTVTVPFKNMNYVCLHINQTRSNNQKNSYHELSYGSLSITKFFAFSKKLARLLEYKAVRVEFIAIYII